MWNVYANRVCGLVFRSDLCSTAPWMMTRSPDGSGKVNMNITIAEDGGNYTMVSGRKLTWIARFEDVLSFLHPGWFFVT